MIDPTKCTITRGPIIVNGRVRYEATLTFSVRDTVQADLINWSDFEVVKEMDERMKLRLHKLIWQAIYGELIGPFSNLLIHARRNCPPNFEKAMLFCAGQIITLLKIKIADKPKD